MRVTSAAAPAYRADIDGLRALAVVAVVVYHAFPAWLPGGFAGVDVFFVISGFLITSLLLRSLSDGTYSLYGFYARRVRRIFPALVVVLGACLAAGWVVLLPKEFAQLGRHATAASAFVANFAFWSESGYFDVEAARKPLLHLWSLGVEEQYYILWPLLLAALWRRARLLPCVVVALVLLSFGANVYLTDRAPEAAFFLPHARSWELLIGALAAWYRHSSAQPDTAGAPNAAPGRRVSAAVRNCASALGLVLMGAAFILLHRWRPFPGWWVLLPTAGTLLVIVAGRDSWINRVLLGHPAVVGVGLISYPLYLWHWPLLSFISIVSPDLPYGEMRALKLAAILAASVLAFLTYRFVELPIRFGRRASPRTVGALCAGVAVLGAAGLSVASDHLRPRLDTPETRRIDPALGDWNYPGPPIPDHVRGIVQPFAVPSASPTKTLFVGDSHVVHYWSRIAHVIERNPAAAAPVFVVGCPPVPLAKRPPPRQGCDRFFELAMGLARAPAVGTVVFSARWHAYVPATGSADDMAHGILVRPDGRPLTGQDIDALWDAFTATVRELLSSGKRVFLIASSPESVYFDPRKMVRRFTSAPPFVEHVDVKRQEATRSMRATTERLRQVAMSTGAVLVDPFDYLCEPELCRTMDGSGRPLYMDTDHLRPYWAIERALFIDGTLTGQAAARR